MRKFYFLLASLFTISGAMKAQTQFYKLVTDPTTEINGKTLLIYDFSENTQNRTGIVHFTGPDQQIKTTQSGLENRFKPTLSYPVTEDAVNTANISDTKLSIEANAQFEGIKNEDGTYSFKNVGVEGYYMPATGTNNSTTAATFELSANTTSGAWSVKSVSGGQYWNGEKGFFVYWSVAHPYGFYRLTEGYSATVNYQLEDGTEIQAPTTSMYETDATPEVPTFVEYKFKGWKDNNDKVDAADETLTALYTSVSTVKVTYTYMNGDETLGTSEQTVVNGETIGAYPALPTFPEGTIVTSTTYSSDLSTVVSEDLEVTVTCSVLKRITDIANVSNKVVYLTNDANNRGSIYAKDGFAWSSKKTGAVVDVDFSSNNFYWAIYTDAEGLNYVYNMGTKTFLSADGTNCPMGDPSSTFYFQNPQSSSVPAYVLTEKTTDRQIAFSNGYTYGIISSYNSLSDNGNFTSIYEARELTAAEISEIGTAISNYINVGPLVAKAKEIFGLRNCVGGYNSSDNADAYDALVDAYHYGKPTDIVALQTAIDAFNDVEKASYSQESTYKIQSSKRNGYLIYNEEHPDFVSNSDVVGLENTTNIEWATVVYNEETYMYNVGSKKFVSGYIDGAWTLSSQATDAVPMVTELQGDYINFSIGLKNQTETDNQAYFNANTGGAFATGITGWYADDEGSLWKIQFSGSNSIANEMLAKLEMAENAKIFKDAQAYIETIDVTGDYNDCIGSYTKEQVDDFFTDVVDFYTTSSPTKEEILAEFEDFKNAGKKVDKTKQYAITCDGFFGITDSEGALIPMSVNLYANTDDNLLAWSTSDDIANKDDIHWIVVDNEDGTYSFKTPGGLYITAPGYSAEPQYAALDSDKENAGRFTLSNGTKCAFQLKSAESDGTLTCYGLSDTGEYEFGVLPEKNQTAGEYVGSYNGGTTEAENPNFFRIRELSTVVGISAAADKANSSEKIYDLQGRSVKKAVKGVYIIGGKKVVVK